MGWDGMGCSGSSLVGDDVCIGETEEAAEEVAEIEIKFEFEIARKTYTQCLGCIANSWLSAAREQTASEKLPFAGAQLDPFPLVQ